MSATSTMILSLTACASILCASANQAHAQETPADGMGPFEIRAGDAGVLRPGFAAQFLGTYGSERGFSLVERRLRFKLDFKSADDRFVGKVQINTVPGALELIDLWAGWNFSDAARLRVGQFTVPLTRYRSGSFSTRLLMDWAPTTAMFGGERQRGVELGGDVGGGLEYRVGLFEGTNARGSHATGATRLYGLSPANPSRIVSPDDRIAPHPEVVARVGWSSAPMNLGEWADREGGPARFYVALSGAWDSNPAERVDWQGRAALEAMFKANGFGLGAIAYASTLETTSGESVLGGLGGVVGASYHLSSGTTVSARGALVQAAEGALEDARVVGADPASGQREWGIGVRQNLLGDELQIGGDLRLEEEVADETTREVVGRLLLQLTL